MISSGIFFSCGFTKELLGPTCLYNVVSIYSLLFVAISEVNAGLQVYFVLIALV